MALNNRVLQDEDDLAAIDSGMPEFLTGMDFSKATFVAIGQLWIQEDGRMTATNSVIPETGDSREAVALAGIVEELAWRYVHEANPEIKRPGQRVVRYAYFLTNL
jgi:hypothetical protein